MATFDLAGFNEVQPKGVMGSIGVFIRHEITSANYPNTADIYRVCKVPREVKIMGATFASTDLDDASSLTWHVYLYDGTTTHDVIGTASSPITTGQTEGVAYMDQFDAAGLVMDSRDWIFYLACIAAPGTDAVGFFAVSLLWQSHLIQGA